MNAPAQLSTGKDTWRTPPELLAALDWEFRFSADLAASPGVEGYPGRPFIPPSASTTGALGVNWAAWCAQFDAWRVRQVKSGFLNPPYSQDGGFGDGLLAWHAKAWQESRNGWTTVLLCPPRPGVTWFWTYALRADEIRFFTQRLGFVDPATDKPARNNTQASCLVIYRPHVPEQGWAGGPRRSWWRRVKGQPAWEELHGARTMPPDWAATTEEP